WPALPKVRVALKQHLFAAHLLYKAKWPGADGWRLVEGIDRQVAKVGRKAMAGQQGLAQAVQHRTVWPGKRHDDGSWVRRSHADNAHSAVAIGALYQRAC